MAVEKSLKTLTLKVQKSEDTNRHQHVFSKISWFWEAQFIIFECLERAILQHLMFSTFDTDSLEAFAIYPRGYVELAICSLTSTHPPSSGLACTAEAFGSRSCRSAWIYFQRQHIHDKSFCEICTQISYNVAQSPQGKAAAQSHSAWLCHGSLWMLDG